MTVFHFGQEVMVVAYYQTTALIKDGRGCERQVPLRTLTNSHGVSYENLPIPKPVPPDVLADIELTRVGKKSLAQDKRPNKHDTLCE